MSDIGKTLRDQIVSRATERCEYCRLPMRGQIAWFPVDHIKPRTAGGTSDLDNLALACPRCNAHKWAFQTGIDPQTGNEEPLFNPRRDSWHEHFELEGRQDSAPQVRGKTTTGRATVDRLQMNHPDVMAIRKLLSELGIDLLGSL